MHYRFRSKSSSFVQSPLTVPAPTMFSSTLCSILRTGETITVNLPQRDDLSLGNPEQRFTSGSDPVHRGNTPDSCYHKDNGVSEKRSSLQTEHLSTESNSQFNQPQSNRGPQVESTQNVKSGDSILPNTDTVLQAADLIPRPSLPTLSYCPQPVLGPNPDLDKDKPYPQDTKLLKDTITFPLTKTDNYQNNSFTESSNHSESGLNDDINSQKVKETCSAFKSQRDTLTSTSTTTQQTIYFMSFPSDSRCTLAGASSSSPQASPLPQSKTLPQISTTLQTHEFDQSPTLTDSALHEARTLTQDNGLLKCYAACSQTTTTIPQISSLPQPYPDSRHGFDWGIPFSQTSKETSSVSRPSSLMTTTNFTQETIYSQSSPSESHCTLGKPRSILKKHQESPFSIGSRALADVHVPILPEQNNISNINISSNTIINSNRFTSSQSHKTVHSHHQSLTSTCTQQCVHDPGITSSSSARPAAPPQSEAQTQALAQQANLHVNPHHHPSSPPHLLTPDKDPDICQPMAVREEIRLTPQIQGPPLSAPPSPLPKVQTESIPQGKASKPGPPCFTRPLSRATVMEGSPVTVEVEVTGQTKPTLTWWVAYNQLHNNTQAL